MRRTEAQEPQEESDTMTDFTDMLAGYRRFRETGWVQQRQRWDELRDGQAPGVMVIACSDSRVDPAQIFDTNPGEIFVVRNVAALVPPFETNPGYHGVSAALEFGVQVLNVGEIVVMGHGLCGGAHAALTQELKNAPPGEGGFIANWIEMLDGARETVVAEFGDVGGLEAHRAMEKEAVKVSITNLRSFPCIRSKERNGKLKLVGAFFAISDGVLNILNENTGRFDPA
jgi:carbonic anhydrase